jgi:hypothetical protein
MSNAAAALCNHDPDIGCDACDPPGEPVGFYGDFDRDWEEAEAEAAACRFDNEPSVYAGTYSEE